MWTRAVAHAPRYGAHLLIRAYQLTLSAVIGQHCRHLPTCSSYTDEAIARHGLWRGGWMGLARICRCNPLGTSGLDLVPETLPQRARWYLPWRYGRWRGVYTGPFVCDAPLDGEPPREAPPRKAAAKRSAASSKA